MAAILSGGDELMIADVLVPYPCQVTNSHHDDLPTMLIIS